MSSSSNVFHLMINTQLLICPHMGKNNIKILPPYKLEESCFINTKLPNNKYIRTKLIVC